MTEGTDRYPRDVEDEGDPQHRRDSDMIPKRLVVASLVVALALLVVVVAVGLARDNLDSTGVAVVLSTLISGIVVAALTRKDDRGGKGRT